jgi:hypothetical protein
MANYLSNLRAKASSNGLIWWCFEKEGAGPSSRSVRHGGQANGADFGMTTERQKQK